MSTESDRPDPDRLLVRVQAEESESSRGKLKIFFGYAAGVGKTYAMLQAARREAEAGAGGRRRLCRAAWPPRHRGAFARLGSDSPREVPYRGVKLREFDLDAALARHPRLILVNELAHTNVEGSRHAKRWLDVNELLDAGIDVWTTLNVQHIESLNDVIAQITGVVVRETLPDAVLERAADLTLVNITPEELTERLKAGKVYIPPRAERALASFFHKGNLVALRELSLRQAAGRVQRDVEAARSDRAATAPWATTERLLVCVGPQSDQRQDHSIVQADGGGVRRRMVGRGGQHGQGGTHARPSCARPWHATCTWPSSWAPKRRRWSEPTSPTRFSTSPAAATSPKSSSARPASRGGSAGHRPASSSNCSNGPAKSICMSSQAKAGNRRPAVRPPSGRRSSGAITWPPPPWWPLAACWPGSAATWGLADANTVMIFLTGVAFVAARLGRGPAVAAALVSVLAFDFFFVRPYYTFAVGDTQYFITFGVMLGIGLLISELTARLRSQLRASQQKERRTERLYRMTRQLSELAGTEFLVNTAGRQLAEIFAGEVVVSLRAPNGSLQPRFGGETSIAAHAVNASVARWVADNEHAAGLGTDTLPNATALFVPLVGSQRVVGVLGVRPADPQRFLDPEQRRLLETCASLIALSIKRDLSLLEAGQAQVQVETEQLRNALLSSVSHDLRTPLATIAGTASSLYATATEQARPLLKSLADEAQRLAHLVNNLLEMARVESGSLMLHRQWHVLEELVGVAVAQVRPELAGRSLEVNIAAEVPLLFVDGDLMTQALANLLENAVRYTPADATIEIAAHSIGAQTEIRVSDNGPGLPAGSESESVREILPRGDRHRRWPPRRGLGVGDLPRHHPSAWRQNSCGESTPGRGGIHDLLARDRRAAAGFVG